MAKKLLGKKGIFNEIFGPGRPSKREASAAGYALEKWGEPKRRKGRKKSAKRRKGAGARKRKYGLSGLALLARRVATAQKKSRKKSSRKPKRNSKGRFTK
jgi:hypothetical protein